MSELFNAILTGNKTIKMICPLHSLDNGKTFTLVENGVAISLLKINGVKTHFSFLEVSLESNTSIILGNRYFVSDELFNRYILDVTPAVNFSDFDDRYFYEPNDLGASYHELKTVFRLWAPLCSEVNLVLNLADEKVFSMKRKEHGVYEVEVNGNLDGVTYLFEIIINDIIKRVTDPYAIGSTLNSKASVIINPKKIKVNLHENKLPEHQNNCDAIIYEASVRDLTSDERTTIKHKGRFLGLAQKDAKIDGEKVGLDYLVNLGITHLQLLPIFDFATVDEEFPQKKYNWGYDPRQYNVVEGSFASNLYDPYSRIIDLKTLIATLHKAKIRVNMDVVYNHVYEKETSVFELIVPGYFFRKNQDGTFSNGSFCGNDLDTKRLMVRKFIINSCVYWVKEFGIDGFRFDLMGMIDLETMHQITEEVLKIKQDFMFYGEGWNMPTALEDHEKTTIANAHKVPRIAFFNDVYRDALKGRTFGDDLLHKGYLSGDSTYRGLFKFAFLGSANDSRDSLFLNPHQSINYVECHDNATLFDKLEIVFENDSEEKILRRLKLINAINIFAYGVPFIHMGQEIGLSKKGDCNSYKSGDSINQFDYSMIKKRKEILNHLIDALKIRKMYECMRLRTKEEIMSCVSYEDLDHGAVLVNYRYKDQELKMFINPSNNTVYYTLPDYYQVVFNEIGIVEEQQYIQSIMVAGVNVILLSKK